MTSDTALHRIVCHTKGRRLRSGTSTIEVLVAFTLLTSVLALSVPLVVRHGRVLLTARHYRLAVDELSNQLERLTSLPEAELQPALARLTPSTFTAARLPGAMLSGALEPADVGQRLTLKIVWDEPQRQAAPVSMAAWVLPDAGRPSGPAPQENPR